MYDETLCPVFDIWSTSLRKADVSPRSSPLRDVSREGTSATQRQKIPYWWGKSMYVYIINPVVIGLQMQICSILRFSWSILVKCCVHLRMNSSKTQMLLLEKIDSTNIDCFVRDSSCINFTFAAFWWVAPPKNFRRSHPPKVVIGIGFNGAETNCGIARILGILLMNSWDT